MRARPLRADAAQTHPDGVQNQAAGPKRPGPRQSSPRQASPRCHARHREDDAGYWFHEDQNAPTPASDVSPGLCSDQPTACRGPAAGIHQMHAPGRLGSRGCIPLIPRVLHRHPDERFARKEGLNCADGAVFVVAKGWSGADARASALSSEAERRL
jgi:hypothetical protein